MSKRIGKKNAAKGRRYSVAEKRAVLEFVESVNLERGRGGVSAAAKRFGVSPLTIANWIRSAGTSVRSSGPRPSAETFTRLAELHEQIVKVEAELARLENDYIRIKSEI